MIDKETREKIDLMFERFTRMEQTIEALGEILVRRRTLVGSTLDRNDDVKKFEEVGHDRVYIEIGDVRVLKRPPKKRRPQR